MQNYVDDGLEKNDEPMIESLMEGEIVNIITNTAKEIESERNELFESKKTPDPASATPALVEAIEDRAIVIRESRKRTGERQEKQAKKLLTNAEKLLGHANIHDKVILFTSELDRGLADAPNILCEIIHKKDVCYQLAC